MLLGQKNRFLQVIGSLSNIVALSKIEGEEHLSQPYSFSVQLYSSADWDKLEPYIGKSLAFRIGEAPNYRIVHGILTELQQHGFTDGQFCYQARIEPWLKMLTLTRNLRVYQRISVPDMVCDIFRKRGFNDVELALKSRYPKLEYCMQYKESDFDFVTRQLEQAGIFYFFRHEEGRHVLVLADHPSTFTHAPLAVLPYQSKIGDQQGYGLRTWHIHRMIIPGSAEMNGYNVKNAAAVSASAKANGGYSVNPKLSIYDDRRQEERNQLEAQAALCMEQWESQSHYARAVNSYPGLQVGHQFTLKGHASADGRYAVGHQQLKAESNLEEGGLLFSSQVALFPANKVFRPRPSVIRPYISGVLSALVVGPSSEEIHTDAQGRIKIQFHWDKEHKKDDDSSCWVRVSQFWNGAKFGAQFVPRVGSEVLVSFVDGDPDSPLVTGTVYNGVKMPPFGLPGQKTQSGIATRSSAKGTVEQGHQLCFEDKKGEEFILLHSQKDMRLKVKNDFSAQIDRNAQWKIEEKRDTQIKKGNDTLILSEGNALTEVKKGDKKQTLDRGNFTTTVSAGNYALEVSRGTAKINVGQKCTITASQGIELKVGASKLSITPAGITIKAPSVTVEGSGKLALKSSGVAELTGTTVKVAGSAMAQLKGGIVQVDATGIAMVKGILTKIG
ncbi:type VI secretion system Vgr family protein [Photorhabdus tasmaniensis]|uniref:type VI secretion system Vgr family protein n=1 Tax=Photorhabdus tasmaniensis TaxID=1004159 RepID=UPI0040425C1D